MSAFRPRGLTAVRRPLALMRDWRWRATGPRWAERAIVVPSWSRAPRLTAAVCRFHLGRRLGRTDGAEVIVYNLPYYAPLARRWPGVPARLFRL